MTYTQLNTLIWDMVRDECMNSINEYMPAVNRSYGMDIIIDLYVKGISAVVKTMPIATKVRLALFRTACMADLHTHYYAPQERVRLLFHCVAQGNITPDYAFQLLSTLPADVDRFLLSMLTDKGNYQPPTF